MQTQRNTQTNSEISEEQQLSAFMNKRKALQNLVDFAKNLEKISAGLQAILHNAKSIPREKQDYKFYMALSSKINSKSVNDVRAHLSEVDEGVVKDIALILDIARTDIEDIPKKFNHLLGAAHNSIFSFLDEYLNEFKRQTRLSMALRMFLTEKNVDIPSLELGFDTKQLESELRHVKNAENLCRTDIREKLVQLVDDADLILLMPDYPGDLKAKLAEIKADLVANIDLLDQGKSLEEVWVSFEVMEMQSDEGDDLDSPLAEENIESAPIESNNADLKAAKRRRNVVIPGFWSVLICWIKAPMGVSWTQAKAQLLVERQQQASNAD